jgi:AcrR family transcriptional regulator
MTKEELGTKEKIMNVAHNLFARRGFDAVSVRDISKEADVNISAISYHFENKLGLYKSIIENRMSNMINDLELIAADNPQITSVEYIGKMFDYYTKNENDLLSSFKFFMSMSEVLKDIELDCMDDDKPPGGKVLESLLIRENPKLNIKELGWAIRSVAGLAFHQSLICCNKCVVDGKKKHGITPKTLRSDLLRTTKLIFDSLK